MGILWLADARRSGLWQSLLQLASRFALLVSSLSRLLLSRLFSLPRTVTTTPLAAFPARKTSSSELDGPPKAHVHPVSASSHPIQTSRSVGTALPPAVLSPCTHPTTISLPWETRFKAIFIAISSLLATYHSIPVSGPRYRLSASTSWLALRRQALRYDSKGQHSWPSACTDWA